MYLVSSTDDVRRAFSHTPLEGHLVEALLAGGANGSLDEPRMMEALRAAADAGSLWAPLWLGDLEVESNTWTRGARREWYVAALERGHPDAAHRLATQSADEAAAGSFAGACEGAPGPGQFFASGRQFVSESDGVWGQGLRRVNGPSLPRTDALHIGGDFEEEHLVESIDTAASERGEELGSWQALRPVQFRSSDTGDHPHRAGSAVPPPPPRSRL